MHGGHPLPEGMLVTPGQQEQGGSPIAPQGHKNLCNSADGCLCDRLEDPFLFN